MHIIEPTCMDIWDDLCVLFCKRDLLISDDQNATVTDWPGGLVRYYHSLTADDVLLLFIIAHLTPHLPTYPLSQHCSSFSPPVTLIVSPMRNPDWSHAYEQHQLLILCTQNNKSNIYKTIINSSANCNVTNYLKTNCMSAII